MKRLVLGICVILVLLVGVRSFAAGKSEESSESQPVVMRFSWWGGEERNQATMNMIEMYMKNNPNVIIEAEFSGWNGYLEKLITQLSAGTEPDIMQIDYTFLAALFKQVDKLVDFKKTTAQVNIDGFAEGMLNGISSPEGELIGLPTGINVSTLYINKSLADELGLDVTRQWTWDDLVSEGRKIHAANESVYLLNANLETMKRYILQPYLYGKTGQPFITNDYELGFDRGSLIKGLQYVQSLYDNGVVEPLGDTVALVGKPITENPTWINGQAVFSMDFLSGYGSYMNSVPGKTIVTGRSIINTDAAITGIEMRPTNMLSVSARSENKDEALNFVNYFLNHPDATNALGLVRSVPANEPARNLLIDANLIQQGMIDAINFAVQYNGGAGQNIMSTNLEVERVIYDVISKVYYQNLTVAEAADLLMTQLTDIANDMQSQ